MSFIVASAAQARDFDIRDFGGSAPKAAEAAARAGGGRVVVPSGVWTSGTVWLRDNVELHLEKGAVLRGSLKFYKTLESVGKEMRM